MTCRRITAKNKEINYVKRIMINYFSSSFMSKWLISLKLKSEKFNIFGYFENDELIGFDIENYYNNAVYLTFIFVKPEMRKIGIGSKILTKIKERNHNKTIYANIQFLNIASNNWNERINRWYFYEKNNFEMLPWTVIKSREKFNTIGFGEHFDKKQLRKLLNQQNFGIMKIKLK